MTIRSVNNLIYKMGIEGPSGYPTLYPEQDGTGFLKSSGAGGDTVTRQCLNAALNRRILTPKYDGIGYQLSEAYIDTEDTEVTTDNR